MKILKEVLLWIFVLPWYLVTMFVLPFFKNVFEYIVLGILSLYFIIGEKVDKIFGKQNF